MSIIKKEFVRRVLLSEAERFEKNQGLQIRRLQLFKTGDLLNNRTFNVLSGSEMDGRLSITHTAHQRFLDIKIKSQSKTNKHRKKNYPIHNRFVYGHYHSIAKRLMFDFTDDVVQGIKNDLNIRS